VRNQGQTPQRDTADLVTNAGGKIMGDGRYPFPDTSDFSSMLLPRAQASCAKVLGLCNAGGDTANCIKQAQEFGLMKSMRVAATLIQSTDIKAISLATVGGLYCSESCYWDLNDRTRARNDRVKTKTVSGVWPNMTQAGDYGVTPHPVYLFQARRRPRASSPGTWPGHRNDPGRANVRSAERGRLPAGEGLTCDEGLTCRVHLSRA